MRFGTTMTLRGNLAIQPAQLPAATARAAFSTTTASEVSRGISSVAAQLAIDLDGYRHLLVASRRSGSNIGQGCSASKPLPPSSCHISSARCGITSVRSKCARSPDPSRSTSGAPELGRPGALRASLVNSRIRATAQLKRNLSRSSSVTAAMVLCRRAPDCRDWRSSTCGRAPAHLPGGGQRRQTARSPYATAG